MQVSQAPARSLIKFKCKSEEDRFMRMAKLILSLKKVAPEDVGLSYTRIFRFLSDLLSCEEFQQLTYYHVTRLINKIYEVSNLDSVGKQGLEKPPTLKKFIYKALDLDYNESKLSKGAIKAIYGMKRHASLWHDCKTIDPNDFWT